MAPHEGLRGFDDDQRVFQGYSSQASQRGEDALYLLIARPALWKFDQNDAGMWGWKLASIAFKVVILCDERCACRLRVGEDI